MKKYCITAAALLAAGTALADAAGLSLLSGFDGFTQTEGAYASNLGTQTLTLTLGGGTVSDAGVLTTNSAQGANNKSYIDLSSLNVGSDGYTISVSFTGVTNTTGNASLAGFYSSGSSYVIARHETAGNGTVGIADNGSSGGRPASGTTTFSPSSAFTLTYAVASDGSYTLFVTQDESTSALTWSGKSHAETNLDSLYLGSWKALDNYKLSASVFKVSFWSGTATESDLPAIINVPEPSAFGLLAGVGALVLVASRRRRKV